MAPFTCKACGRPIVLGGFTYCEVCKPIQEAREKAARESFPRYARRKTRDRFKENRKDPMPPGTEGVKG